MTEQEIKTAAQTLGRKGGLTTKKRYGVKFLREMGKRGGRPKQKGGMLDLAEKEGVTRQAIWARKRKKRASLDRT